ncbi:FtsX-like permease family protein [Spirosoma sp. HMF4905]|uniref:FtsX-like permease family protein n=1 Tax=Spirosoma arboris TaxID=2682092 RepID=A0A7K1SHH5_9BACT|nr:ABC transporter permease [Spirosoma arboris]MVM33056.1 FtsX-like permease family protein [Spirosoma arboris]
MLTNYFKIAFRRLWADKTNAVINVLGLTLGITCCLVIYLFVRYELSFDQSHTNAGRIYRVVQHNRTSESVQHWPTTAYPLAEAIRQDIPGVGVTQTAGPESRLINSVDSRGTVHRFEEKRVMFADAQYLQTFDFATTFPNGIWLAGNAQTAFQQPNAVVLTQKLAERYFASYTDHLEQVVGKQLTLNNSNALTVLGIIRNPPSNTNLPFDLLINYAFFKANNQYQATNWSGNYEGTTYVTLPAGTDPKAVERQLVSLQKKYMKPEDIRRISYVLQPLSEIHTEPLYGNSLGSYVVSRDMLWGLASLAVFLILIASFNFINLTTAQAIRRRKEVGVRKVVGSTQVQLFSQFIGETLLIAVVAGLLSLGALNALLNWVNQSLTIIDLNLSADVTIWAFSAGLILVVALLAGFYPALVLSNFQPISALKNITPQRRDRFSLRHGLIVLQFCITYGLLVGTFVASRQMNLFKDKELGFTKDAVLTINGPRNQIPGKLTTFRNQLLQNPNVTNVSFGSGAPITNNHYGTSFRLKSEAEQMNRQAEEKFVDLAYQSLFGLKIVAGRWFTQSNDLPEGKPFNAFVVNETMVQLLGLTPEKAIGQTIIINEGVAPILGVVKDFHNTSLQQPIKPCVMMCWNTGFYDQIHLQIQTQNGRLLSLPQTLSFIETTWKKLFPDDVYQYTFLNEALTKNYIIEQLVFDAFRIFAAISIFISCLGLFGLITFAANQRTKEIGLRKVLGASVASIVALLSTDFLKLVLIAIVVATPVAWYVMNQWLQDFAYKIDIEWWLFALAGLLAIGIALLTVSFQSVKAALMNPVKSLRSE